MNSKDKPKRGEAKTFVREVKPKTAPKASEGAAKSAGGFKKKIAAKNFAAKDAAEEKPVRVKRMSAAAEGAPIASDGKPERISKILARAGVASRRDIERMILDGRVKLNGKVLDTPVVNVTLDDKIEVDDVPIRGIERTRLWLYHKPAGLVTTNSDPEGRPTVFDNLPEGLPRVLSIGRLDINTEGLLLLTNDGGLSRVLELPTTGWLRRYRVRAYGEVDQEALDKLKDGIAVDGVLYGSIEATLDRAQGHNVWITMGLREGKNREIKNVLGALGLEVNRLIRLSYGPFQLGDLPEGQVLEVRGRTLRDQLGPRLVNEAKANFDAPLYNERPDAEEKPAARRDADAGDRRPARAETRGEGRGEDRREQAPGRLDAKRGSRAAGDRKFGDKKFADKGRGKPSDRGFADDKPKRPPMGTSRTANVWMAPGARPTADGSTRRTSARAEAEQLFKKPAPENDRRVVVKRAEEDSDWIRADAPADEGRDGGRGFGGRKTSGDRPDRGDRGFGDKPRFDRKPRADGERSERPARGERSFDKPRGERSYGDKPRGDRPSGDRPFGDRPRFDRKPREDGERSFGERKPRGEGEGRPARAFGAGEGRSERPRGDRPAGERPSGDRPFGGKPAGGRGFGGKPGGAKSFGGKPGGRGGPGKPGGARPGGSRPGGSKPSGSRPGGSRPGGKPRSPRG